MFTNINLCTTVLPQFPFTDAIEIASSAGYQGIELRVDDNYHQSLADLQHDGVLIKRSVEQSGLQLPILSSYNSTE